VNPAADGARSRRVRGVDGRITGTFRSWHDNGQLNEEIEMKGGKPDGLGRAWYPSGFLKAQTTLSNGEVVARETWKDGQRRSALAD